MKTVQRSMSRDIKLEVCEDKPRQKDIRDKGTGEET